MQHLLTELRRLIAEFENEFSQIKEDVLSIKPGTNKWSKKEILGHLIDSAHNNYRRFITCQYETSPPQIYYDQDIWVSLNQYQQMNQSELILLWKLLNERICVVLENMDVVHYNKLCNVGPGINELRTILFIAEDYVRHLKHHLAQISNNQ